MSDIKPVAWTNEIELEYATSRPAAGGMYWPELRTRSAIPLYDAAALAAARRQALEDAARVCDEYANRKRMYFPYDCAAAIRALIEEK